MILLIPDCYSMCDLIKVLSIQILAVVERLYAAPILCGARRDLVLESGRLYAYESIWSLYLTSRIGLSMHMGPRAESRSPDWIWPCDRCDHGLLCRDYVESGMCDVKIVSRSNWRGSCRHSQACSFIIRTSTTMANSE